jgi:hypothetical protein
VVLTRAPFTQAGLRRAIEAAHKAGLRVRQIRPDGTLIVDDGREPIAEIDSVKEDEALSKWRDVQP